MHRPGKALMRGPGELKPETQGIAVSLKLP